MPSVKKFRTEVNKFSWLGGLVKISKGVDIVSTSYDYVIIIIFDIYFGIIILVTYDEKLSIFIYFRETMVLQSLTKT